MPHVVLLGGHNLVVDDGLWLVLIVGVEQDRGGVEQDRGGVDPHIHHVLGPHVIKAGPVQGGYLIHSPAHTACSTSIAWAPW